MVRKGLLAGYLLVVLGSPAYADALPKRDQTFLQDQARGTAYELAIAKLAIDRAGAADIKAYAQQVVSDHEKLNTQLMQLAASKGVTLSTNFSHREQVRVDRLQQTTGAAFDSYYKSETTRVNDEDKKQDASELGKVTDPDVKSFVQALQAADQKHYEMGRALK